MFELLSGIALVCVIWGIVSLIAMATYLSQKGIKINILFFRLLAFKYIHQYYKLSMEENGKPGPWFHSYLIAMNTALGLVIIGLILKRVTG